MGVSGSLISSSVSRTSAIRSPETAARGKKINNIDIIKKAKTICMAYCIKAIISPTCMVASATWWEPTQIIPNERPFMTSIITGIIVTITRATNKPVSVKSRLAISKRFSSSSCLLNARITIMPDRFSRVTRFSRSIRSCIILNFGTAIIKTMMIKPTKVTTATAIIHHILALFSTARIIPPIPMMGA